MSLSRISAAVVVAMVIGASAFVAGRMTVEAGSGCTDARQVVAQAESDVQDWVTDPERQKAYARVAANAVLQNEGCFSASQRAQAQTVLDNLAMPEPDRLSESYDTFFDNC